MSVHVGEVGLGGSEGGGSLGDEVRMDSVAAGGEDLRKVMVTLESRLDGSPVDGLVEIVEEEGILGWDVCGILAGGGGGCGVGLARCDLRLLRDVRVGPANVRDRWTLPGAG